LSTVIRIAFLTLVVAGLPLSVWRAWARRRAESLALLRSLRVSTFLIAIPMIAVTVTLGIALIQLPVLRWGWWALLDHGRPQGPIATLSGSMAWIAVPFLLLVLAALPRMVLIEERIYREGAEFRSPTRNLLQALRFGLAHSLWLGIPIGFGLALGIGGLWFTRRYLAAYRTAFFAEARQFVAEQRRTTPHGAWIIAGSPISTRPVRDAAVLQSASAHLAWNTTIFALAFTATIVSVFYK